MAADWLSSEVAPEVARPEEPDEEVVELLQQRVPAPALRSTELAVEEALPAWQQPEARCPS